MATQAEKIETNELFIGGEWVAPQGSRRIDVFSPSTEEPIGSVPEGSEELGPEGLLSSQQLQSIYRPS